MEHAAAVPPPRHAGTAALEFMLAGMLLLAASIATVETMYWHQMRHLAYLALIERHAPAPPRTANPAPSRGPLPAP